MVLFAKKVSDANIVELYAINLALNWAKTTSSMDF